MKITKISCLILIFFAFLLINLFAQEAQVLTYKYKKGMILSYKANIDINRINSEPMKMEIFFKQNVLEHQQDKGLFKIQINSEKLIINGKEKPGKKTMAELIINNNGNTENVITGDKNFKLLITFPKKAIKPGDEWQSKSSVVVINKYYPIMLNVKFLEYTIYDGKKIALFEYNGTTEDVRLSGFQMKIDITGKLYFDIEKGLVFLNSPKSVYSMNEENKWVANTTVTSEFKLLGVQN